MNFRKFGKYICALSLVAVMSVTTMGATTISDVKNTHWAYTAITDLEERGIMMLTSSGQFYPDQTMNYFEVADVVAKATGYVDVDITADVDATFKEKVKENYEKQKATIESYAAKYTSWNSGYNQQIAYLIGRGYMKVEDLDKFITKTDKGEVKNIVTKEQLSVYIVRMLGKEITATSTYKTTTFSDDSTLQAANKPYVEYLKSVGIVNPDAAGKVNGTMKVTKALCAKMVSDSLKIKDNSQVWKKTTSEAGTQAPTSTSTPETNTSGVYTVNKVITKNTNESYILLQNSEGKQSYYSFKNTTKIYNESGVEVPLTKLVGNTVKATIELEGSTEYITKLTVTEAGSTTTPTGTQASGETTTVSGTLTSSINNDIVRITLADGTSKVYLISDNCVTSLNGAVVSDTSNLVAGDSLVLTLSNNAVTRIAATTSATSGKPTDNTGAISTLTSGEVTAKKFAGNNYILTVVQGNTEQQMTVANTVAVTRNNKSAELSGIRIGDTVKITRADGVITAIAATGEKATVDGTIKAIYYAATPQIVVNVKNEDITYTVASNAEVYDHTINDYISLRDLHLGHTVTLMLESKEVTSIDVDETDSSYKLMGTIEDIGRNYSYIDVLVDYDYISGESQVYKRIELPSDIVVVVNGRNKSRSALDEDMDIVINYKYLDDTTPEKIVVI